MQRAVQAGNRRIHARRHLRRQVAAGRANPDDPVAGRKAIRAGYVIRQHARRRNRQQVPSVTLPLSTCAVGTSSMMSTRIVPVVLLPWASVTV